MHAEGPDGTRWVTGKLLGAVVCLLIGTALPAGPAGAQSATCLGLAATIVGTPGNDTLSGTEGDDVIAGLGGNDTIFGNGGNDVICGDDGDDTIDGGAGSDAISAGNGNDVMR